MVDEIIYERSQVQHLFARVLSLLGNCKEKKVFRFVPHLLPSAAKKLGLLRCLPHIKQLPKRPLRILSAMVPKAQYV